MPQLNIPPLGTVLVLEKDWTFKLFEEHRNQGLMNAARLAAPRNQVENFWEMTHAQRLEVCQKSGWSHISGNPWSLNNSYACYGEVCRPFVFRAGTELKIERIYIRQGQIGFNSVTFRTKCWMSEPGDPLFFKTKGLKSLRFWAKLEDANTIVYKEGRE